MQVVINCSHTLFRLSKQAYKELGIPWDRTGFKYTSYDARTRKELIDVVEKLGDKAGGPGCRLVIVDVPDDIEWEIEDYDNSESICEKKRYF